MKYILEGKEPIPEPDIEKWSEWFEEADRHIGYDGVGVDIQVSTVFMGVDYRHSGVGKPLLFETMIFGGKHDMYQERYTTWDEAEKGHEVALALAKEKKEECSYFKKYKTRPVRIKKSARRGSAKEARSIAHKKRSKT